VTAAARDPAEAAAIDLPSEVASPERRRFILAVGAINAVFLAIDLAAAWPHRGVVVAARVALSAVLIALPVWLARRPSPAAIRIAVRASAVALSLCFVALAWASGAEAGPYLYFLPMLAMVFTIAVPDDPAASLLSGVTAAAAGIPLHEPLAGGAQRVAFLLAAYGSVTVYATVAAAFHRRQRLREAVLERERARSVADLAESERRRADAERLALVGRLSASVAHELNNPLAFVVSGVAALGEAVAGGRSRPGAPDVDELLGDVRLGLDRMRNIVDDLRAFARDAPDRVEPCRVEATVDEALRLASLRLRGVAPVDRDVAPGLPDVLACHRRLVQVFVNLLVNAADALDAQGIGRAARVRVTARRVGGAVEVSVEDSGPGLADEIRAHLFEPFHSTKGERGTGLGLSLSREYLLRFGGSIEARETALGGACFVVRLPAA
jgi:signal transduction histidine kinase